MSNTLYILGSSATRWITNTIDKEYKSIFKWVEGRRLPDESKAVHIVCKNALSNVSFTPDRCFGNRVGIVLAGIFGGFASYERFRAGLNNTGELQPLAFSFSLPCIPASVLSLYYGITGPVLSLSTTIETSGFSALDTAVNLLQSDMCDHVIAGTWYFPSDTAIKCTGITQAMSSIVILSKKIEQKNDSSQKVANASIKIEASKMMHPLYEFLSLKSSFYTKNADSLCIDNDLLMQLMREE